MSYNRHLSADVCDIDAATGCASGFRLPGQMGAMDEIYATLGRSVRKRRENLRLTQADLGAKIGLSRASIANIEGGRQAVLLHQFLALAEALTVQPTDLIPLRQPAGDPRELPEEVMKFVQTYRPRNRDSHGSSR
jgi:transcriptional regulator with XRE-family HTH domain